jgi:hypothetical protein
MELAKNDDNNITIKKLEYSPEVTQKLHKLLNSNMSQIYKNLAIKRLIGTKCCCVCSAIPVYELTYHLDNATKVERYCERCYNKYEENELKYQDPNKYFVIVPSVSRYERPLKP